MFKRLIIATDLSPEAYAVLHCLDGLRVYGAEECLLLQCLPMKDIAPSVRGLATAVLEKNLQGQRAILEAQGYMVKTRVVAGVAKNEINRIAVDEDYSMIVVGAQAHSMTGEVFMGGLAYELIHHVQKPVLLIRLEDDPQGGLTCAKTIGCDISSHVLFVTDFSANADQALEYVLGMVAAGARQVTLLHVQDKSLYSLYLTDRLEEFTANDQLRLELLKKQLQVAGKAEIGVMIRYGSPSVEILNAARELNVQLIVMGSQGTGYVKELFLGSVSHNVARHAASSVLLIPAIREDE